MRKFIPIFSITTLLSIHFGTILFINSSLLSRFFEQDTVSLLFFIGALGNIILFLLAPKLIEWVGKGTLLLFFLVLAFISTIGLGFASSAVSVFVFFTIYSSILFIIYYCLDIFLEEISLDTKTGEVRGLYYTFFNLGLVIGPLVLALFVFESNFKLVYTAAALILVPVIFLVFTLFGSHMPTWHGLHPKHMFLPFGLWWKAINIRRITMARLMLELFFALMVIYVPIYLYSIVGFDWAELGIIFTVMLLPFILFQWPAGELADRFYGEKEILSLGFIITATSLLVMPFLGKVFIAWMVILFISRVGASLIEVMTESYFFKQVTSHDTRLISIFRLTRPVSIALAAIFGAIALNLFSFDKIFYIMLVAIVFGLKEALMIKDTK